tara:strand:- start:5670 stop:6164 length:495 start_codon:yes stop_codon:yes gene_type:complete
MIIADSGTGKLSMSNFSQVRELLQHNQQLHARASTFYQDLAFQADNERVKMLLATLAKHEAELCTSMLGYIQKAPAKILNTYFQFDHEHGVDDLFANKFVTCSITSSQVEAIATDLDNYFCDLYQEMVDAVDCQQVQELFEHLHLHMIEEKKRLSIDIYSMLDM